MALVDRPRPEPYVLASNGGDVVADEPERKVVIKAGIDELALTWSRYAEGQRGPGRHVHHHHTDAFYVLEGALVFEVGPDHDQIRGEAGTLALVPPNVVHTFWNDGPGEARYLNVHAPSGNFHEVMRARRDGRDAEGDFDSHDPPADGGRPASDAVIRPPGEGEELAMGPSRALFKAEGTDGDGTFSLTETTLAPGFPGPPLHRHETFADSFYVLEGTLTLLAADGPHPIEAGGFAFAAPGAAHTFANRSGAPVRFLNLMAPGGFEQYLKEAAAASADGPPDPGTLAAIAVRYDFRPVES